VTTAVQHEHEICIGIEKALQTCLQGEKLRYNQYVMDHMTTSTSHSTRFMGMTVKDDSALMLNDVLVINHVLHKQTKLVQPQSVLVSLSS